MQFLCHANLQILLLALGGKHIHTVIGMSPGAYYDRGGIRGSSIGYEWFRTLNFGEEKTVMPVNPSADLSSAEVLIRPLEAHPTIAADSAHQFALLGATVMTDIGINSTLLNNSLPRMNGNNYRKDPAETDLANAYYNQDRKIDDANDIKYSPPYPPPEIYRWAHCLCPRPISSVARG